MKNLNKKLKNQAEGGFSYVEVVVGLSILLIGIMAGVTALSANLIRSFETEKRIIAKQYALSTIESITAAREISYTGVIDSWNSVRNIDDDNPGGIFVNGFRPIREDLGWDGVTGTIDDACSGTDPCVVPGRTDNTSRVIPGFERSILIEDIIDPDRPPPNPVMQRRITVTINFQVNQVVRQETISTVLTSYE